MNFLPAPKPMRRLGVVAVLALVLGALTATPALAHSRLISSTPGKGKSAESVTEVKLVFSDKISLAKVVVKDAQNKTYQSGEAERSGTTVTQQLTGPLPAGSYTVAYRVVGEDGHPIESDDLTFTATGARPPRPRRPPVRSAPRSRRATPPPPTSSRSRPTRPPPRRTPVPARCSGC